MKTNNRAQEFLSKRFRKLLSGDPNGIPPWLPVVAAGDQPGLFVPTDAPWVVHGDFSTLVGGIRALILQALHPATLAGVAQHSRYKTDPLGRLSGTIRWLTVTTFGSVDAIQQEASRVNRLHEKIRGEVGDSQGQAVAYSARDPRLLLWVHLAFTEAFLSAQLEVSSRPIPGGADAYVDLWRKSAVPLGLELEALPKTRTELSNALREFAEHGELRFDAATAEVMRFIERPPLPKPAALVYRVLFRAAIASLPDWAVELTGYRVRNPQRVLWVTKWLLIAMRKSIGPESPIEDAAIARLRRAGVI